MVDGRWWFVELSSIAYFFLTIEWLCKNPIHGLIDDWPSHGWKLTTTPWSHHPQVLDAFPMQICFDSTIKSPWSRSLVTPPSHGNIKATQSPNDQQHTTPSDLVHDHVTTRTSALRALHINVGHVLLALANAANFQLARQLRRGNDLHTWGLNGLIKDV